MVARGVPGVIGFLAIPLFTRLLSPADYGRYALVVATTNLLNALLFQWLRLSLVRYLPVYQDNPARLKSTMMTATAALVLGLGLVAAIICLLPAMRAWQGVVVACWTFVAIQSVFDLSCESARASIRPWRYMVLQLARSCGGVALGVGFVALGAAWWGPLGGLCTGMALACAWSWRGDWGGVRLTIDRESLLRLCRYGMPLSLTVALVSVVASCDRFLIAWYLGEEAAGLYAVAVDFTSQTLGLLMMVISMAVFPLAVRAFERQGPEAARDLMRSNVCLQLALGLPCVIGLTLLAPGVAHCFFGESFRAMGAKLMPVVALGALLAGLKAYYFDAAFQFAHQTVYQVWIVLAAAVVNVVLNLIAIPRWGLQGSAIASVLAYAISIGLTTWFGRRHFALPVPVGAVAVVLLAGGTMAAVLAPFRQNVSPMALTAQVAGGAAVYGGILVAMNFLGLRDAMRRAAGRLRRSSGAGPVVEKRLSPAHVPTAERVAEPVG